MPPAEMFSVIIPTLQRSRELRELVAVCAEHPTVREVIVVNNHPRPLDVTHEKLRVLQQESNIYVNPAWNLGVREARAEYVILLNDDVLFEPALLDLAARAVRAPFTGVVGLDSFHLNQPTSTPEKIRIATYREICRGFGMFMAMRRSNYVQLPEELKIWGGDDILYRSQRWPNRVIMGPRVASEIGVTSGSAEFSPLAARDAALCERYLREVVGSRWWHRPEAWWQGLRDGRHRVLTALRSARSRRGGAQPMPGGHSPE